MKQGIVTLLCITFVLGTFTGCGSKQAEEDIKSVEETNVQAEETDVLEEVSEDYKKAYTKEEINELVLESGYKTYFAVKRGDSFYLIKVTDTWGENYFDNSTYSVLWLADGKETMVIDYENGDEIVAFSTANTSGFGVRPIISMSERYCLPTMFQQNNDGTITKILNIDAMETSYVSGDENLDIFEEYTGTTVMLDGIEEYVFFDYSCLFLFLY